jgi:acetolactate synthase-1/2/3 large subunit
MTIAHQAGADVIGQMLVTAGASHVFGIPGGEVLALLDGIDRAGLRFVLVKHENAGGFMAEGHWHTTGHLPVLVATLGPGVTNAVNVVANALQDRVPLIFLTGCVDQAEAETYTHQVIDHQSLLRPVVKGSFRATTGAVAQVMAKAITLALSGQPGPVHVDVPIGVAEGAEPSAALAATLPDRPVATEAQIARLQAALDGARRPIAIAGVDAVNEAAGPAIAEFCRAHGVPLITTYKGKGLLAEDDPLSLMGAGLSPRADRVLLPLLAGADLVLLLGYDPIEMRIGWRNPFAADQRVIEIAPVPRLHGMHRSDETVLAGVAGTLARLQPGGGIRWQGGEVAAARKALHQAFLSEDRPWGPHAAFRTLRRVLPDTAILTADSGAHRILLSQMWQARAPRHLLQSSGFCTMACALPLAMGARLGRPEAPVVAVMGDAGLEMGVGDLATLRDLGLPLIVCVLVDESLTLIEMKQRGSGRPNLGVDFGATDFPALAQAFGGHGAWVDDADGMETALRQALDRPGFSLLAVRIGRKAYDNAF